MPASNTQPHVGTSVLGLQLSYIDLQEDPRRVLSLYLGGRKWSDLSVASVHLGQGPRVTALGWS